MFNKTTLLVRDGTSYSNPKNFVADFSTSQKKRNIVFRNEGGVRGRLEVFQKFIEFDTGNAPLIENTLLVGCFETNTYSKGMTDGDPSAHGVESNIFHLQQISHSSISDATNRSC